MKPCSICNHPERAKIDRALVEGVSLRTLLTRHDGTSRSALDRHRKHIPAALAQAKQAAEVAEATTVLSRIDRLATQCQRMLDQAELGGKIVAAAAVARELRGCLELLAKISGELRPGNINSFQVNIGGVREGIEGMTDAELEDAIRKFCGWGGSTVRDLNLFDNETVPPLAGYETNNRYTEDARERDIREGRPPRGWEPWRPATPQDRFLMLQVLWKRLTAVELGASAESLGRHVSVQIRFDLGETSDFESLWPKVGLIVAAPGVPEPLEISAPQVIEGQR